MSKDIPGNRRPHRFRGASAALLVAVLAGAATASQQLEPIYLADGPGGLQVVSAPAQITLTVGHVAHLPVQIQGFARSIDVRAELLIHTFVNEVTAGGPGPAQQVPVAVIDEERTELTLQTLRLRAHALALSFVAGPDSVTVVLTIDPVIAPRTPLFGVRTDPYYDGLPEPFAVIFGPDCAPCPTTPGDPPGTTRDVACGKAQDTCRCHWHGLEYMPGWDSKLREKAPTLQRFATHFLRSVGGWTGLQTEPDLPQDPASYLWNGLDWSYAMPGPAEGYTPLTPEERDYSPLFSGILAGDVGWVMCPQYTNPDGSLGLFDPSNTFLMDQLRGFVRRLGERYAGRLLFVEMANEPAAEFYLCPCLVPGGGECASSSGPNQAVCSEGPNSLAFDATYGELLRATTALTAEELAAVNPGAVVITGAIDMPPTGFGLSATTEGMIARGLLDEQDNVVIGIHQYPCFSPPPWIRRGTEAAPSCRNDTDWLSSDPYATLNCAYYQPGHDIYWMPCGCETAPPLSGTFQMRPDKTVSARELWAEQDRRADLSDLLEDAEGLGVLDRFFLFDTELHAGFKGSDETTTTPREALSGLRIGAINAHQKVIGTEFVLPPLNLEGSQLAAAYNLMVKHLAGVTPVYAWDAPLIGADYSGLVYKLFTRGEEDIVTLWSNADRPYELVLSSSPATSFAGVVLTRLRAAGADLTISTSPLAAPPQVVQVQPLIDFVFLSVLSDDPVFAWLDDVTARPAAMRIRRRLRGR